MTSADSQHWIAPLAAQEQSRLRDIAVVKSKAPRFLEELNAAMAADIDVYLSHFPKGSVGITFRPSERVIYVRCGDSGREVKATIEIDLAESALVCKFEGLIPSQDLREKLTLSQGELAWKSNNAVRGVPYCSHDLSEAILRKVLFPRV